MTNESASSGVIGRYEMISSENYGDFLKALGVGMIQRNLSEKARSTIDISITDGVWTIKTLTALKNTEIRFEPGKEFPEEIEDGREFISVVTLEGNSKLVHVGRRADEMFTITSAFGSTELKQTYSARGVTAIRVFIRR